MWFPALVMCLFIHWLVLQILDLFTLSVSVSLVSNNRPLIQIVRVIAPIYK